MKIAIIGGGPAGLCAAYFLAKDHTVTLYERGKTVGRKFLVAGDGGLNITNNASGQDLFDKFTPTDFIQPLLETFGPLELRNWLEEISIATFVGSSGRVFPNEGTTPATVLAAIRNAVNDRGVIIHVNNTFVGFNSNARPIIRTENTESVLAADHYVFALGGASWPRSGSKGEWLTHFEQIGVGTKPFEASNCGVEVDWPAAMQPHAGEPLKNIAVHSCDKMLRGEANITGYGLEGNAIYPVVPEVRTQLQATGKAEVIIDLKPDLTIARIMEKLMATPVKNWQGMLSLTRAQYTLAKAYTTKEQFALPKHFAQALKQLHIPVTKLRPIEEAISTVGGISLHEITNELKLKKHPHISVAGEMLDTDAPTGGYLLQGAFSMGYWVGCKV